MKTKFFKTVSIAYVLLLTSCASFNNGMIPVQKMTPVSVNSISGEYGITSMDEDSIVKANWKNYSVFDELNRKLLKDTIDLDILRKYSFKIDVMNKDLVGITYKMMTGISKPRFLKQSLKKTDTCT